MSKEVKTFNIFKIFKIFSTDFIGMFGFINNICVWEIGTSGNKNGYLSGLYGEITPNATFEGEYIYEYTWDVVTGLFTMSFGDGTVQLTNIDNILITHHTVPDGNTAIWNATNTAYEYTDLTLAQYIGTDVNEACFYVAFNPLILWLYSLIPERGTKI